MSSSSATAAKLNPATSSPITAVSGAALRILPNVPSNASRRDDFVSRMHLMLLGERLASCARVLEFGCGATAAATKFFATRSCETFACDPSEAAVQRARFLAPRATFLIGGVTELDFPEDYFDLIFSESGLSPLGHEERLTTMRQLANMLRPAALLVVGMVPENPNFLDEVMPSARAVGLSLAQVADSHYWFAKT